MKTKLEHCGDWDAIAFFRSLTDKNLLARKNHFHFCVVSDLNGFEEAVAAMQSHVAFICVSDIEDGYTNMNNTPVTRRIKTVFMAMRHPVDDMHARTRCMDTMREIYRQFLSVIIQMKSRLQHNMIYLDPNITFNEIDRYFFSGCAGAYFQIAVDCPTDLIFNPEEWSQSPIL